MDRWTVNVTRDNPNDISGRSHQESFNKFACAIIGICEKLRNNSKHVDSILIPGKYLSMLQSLNNGIFTSSLDNITSGTLIKKWPVYLNTNKSKTNVLIGNSKLKETFVELEVKGFNDFPHLNG